MPALRGLTLRGQAFVAAGLACGLGALLVGQQEMVRLGAFLVLLPVVAAVAVGRTRYRLSCSRSVVPERLPVGHPATVVLRLENLSRVSTSLLFLEDLLPPALGGRPRFVLDRVEGGGSCEVSYSARSDVRGQFAVGPLSVRLGDPFGLCELTRSFTAVDHLVVTPVISRLPAVNLGGEWAGGGETRARLLGASTEDDASTREYRLGDDLRKVHWKSTARTGEMMVRREERPWQSRATLLLDTRRSAHQGSGPASSFEWAVSAAGSVGVHLARGGYQLRYICAGTEQHLGSGGTAEGLLLDRLAAVAPSREASLAPTCRSMFRAASEGLVVAVLGGLSAAEALELARLRYSAPTCIAVLMDTVSWVPTSPRGRAEAAAAYSSSVGILRQAGWRVLEARAGGSLAALWPQAALRAPEGGPMTGAQNTARLLGVSAAAVLTASLGLSGVYTSAGWAPPVVAAVLVAFGAGWVGRRLDIPPVLAPAVSTVGLVGFLGLVFFRASTAFGLPTPSTLRLIGASIGAAGRDIQRLAAPVEPNPDLVLMTSAGAYLVAVLVDLAVFRLRRPVLAGLPLLALYVVPASLDPDGVAPLLFAAGAAGYLLLLVSDMRERTGTWGRRLSRRGVPDELASAPLPRMSRRVGAVAIGLALVVPALTPEPGKGLLGGYGDGSGNGSGAASRQVLNPIVSLQPQLRSPQTTELLRVRTDTPDYLRLTVLDRFDGTIWSQSSFRSGDDTKVGENRPLPPAPGLDGVPTRLVRDEITVRELDVYWLPMPYAASRVDVKGDWRYDQQTRVVFSAKRSARRVRYTSESLVADPSPADLDRPIDYSDPELRARHGLDPYFQVPSYVPPIAVQLVDRLGRGKLSPYRLVAAIQDYLHTTGGFTYDLDVAPGNRTSDLENFLVGKRGYCEQFAATMAYLVRLSGIPARLAIGFTPGQAVGAEEYSVTNKDAHAWPEVFFPGAGWVRFEPTPSSDGRTAAPAYTDPQVGGPGGADADDPAQDTPTPSEPDAPAPGGSATTNLREDPNLVSTAPAEAENRRRGGLLPWGAPAGVVLLVTPALLRLARRRWRRRRAGSPQALVHAAWRDLLEDAEDVGRPVRTSETPRTAARRLSQEAGLAVPAADALAALAQAEERARYAPGPPLVDGVAAQVRVVRRGLLRTLSRRGRLRTQLLPRSLVRQVRRGLASAYDGLAGGLSRMGAAVRRGRGPRPADL